MIPKDAEWSKHAAHLGQYGVYQIEIAEFVVNRANGAI